MAGYGARQSTYVDTDTILAAHSNDEFNAILAAFHLTTGHKHDGSTSGDGPLLVITGALNSGSITSGFGNINTGSSTITTTGAITGGSVVVDNLSINTNTITATSGAVNIVPASGSAILLDGTISVDAGVVTGATSITSTAFVGTLSTAAQANITSVGTLTGLTISGALIKSVTNSITAGSTQTQAGAAALTTDINRVVTVGTNGDGVKLPTAVAGAKVEIINDDAAQTIQIWPATGDAIDGGSANAVDANSLAAGGDRTYFSVDATNWYTKSSDEPAASSTVAGIQENATDAEGITGTATDRTMTPANVQAKVASATAKGIIEQTTPAEDVLGADTARATTAAGIAAAAQGMLWHSITSTGAADVQVLTPVPAITAYAAYQQWFFLPVADNTGACTLNVSGLGTRNIRKIDGAGALTDPAAGDLDTVVVAHVIDDGAQLILQNPAVSTGATLANLGIPNHDDIDVSANGEMTIPTQPSFLAWCDAQANVTGDGTNYQILFANEIYDQNSDFTSSTFTAPVAGRYLFGFNVRLDGITSNHVRGYAQLVVSNGPFFFHDYDFGAIAGGPGGATVALSGICVVDMDASDIVRLNTSVSATDKTVDVAAGSSSLNFGSFFGCLLH